MYDRTAKQPTPRAEGPKLSMHIKKTHKQLNEYYTIASRWTLAILLLYAFAPSLTPKQFIHNVDETASSTAGSIGHLHLQLTRPHFAWMQKETN